MNRKNNTKEKLLTAALTLIWKSSFGSVSVDDICAEANVLKGSFFHFFPSKVDLAIEAVKHSWKNYRPELERIYAPDKEPLQRFRDHCDFTLARQKEMLEICGFVPGCPMTSLGSEQGTQNKALQEVIDYHMKDLMTFYRKAIKDAVKEGAISETNIERKTLEVFSFYLGTFTCARITNDLKPIRNMKESLMHLLGAEILISQ